MKQAKVFFLFLLTTCLFAACSSDDDNVNSLLCKTWLLVSYGNKSNEVLKEAEGYYYELTFHPDGTYSGLAYGNNMEGYYSCKGNTIKIDFGIITQLLVEGSDQDEFYLKHLFDVKTYTVTDTELRLYYSEDQYFKFRVYNDRY